MLREKINTLFNSNREELNNYLSVLSNMIISKYKIDAEILCKDLGFELDLFNKDVELNSYLKIYPDKVKIGINDKIDEYNKNYYIFKESLFYFIYRYFLDNNKIDKEEKILNIYKLKYEKKLDIDYITDYFSCVLLNECCVDKRSINRNNKNYKKYNKIIKKMVNK